MTGAKVIRDEYAFEARDVDYIGTRCDWHPSDSSIDLFIARHGRAVPLISLIEANGQTNFCSRSGGVSITRGGGATR